LSYRTTGDEQQQEEEEEEEEGDIVRSSWLVSVVDVNTGKELACISDALCGEVSITYNTAVKCERQVRAR
jgi:hypothetical protein